MTTMRCYKHNGFIIVCEQDIVLLYKDSVLVGKYVSEKLAQLATNTQPIPLFKLNNQLELSI